MSKIFILDLKLNFNGVTDFIHPVIFTDEKEMILIDCGYPRFLTNIKTQADKQGLDLNKLTKIIITHHDFDHMGALAQFKKEYPWIKILSSKEQQPYISGKKRSLRLKQAEQLHNLLPEEKKEESLKIQQVFANVENEDIDIVLNDKEVLPYCGGLEIIDTSGHMPGHISVYNRKFKTLICGDALAVHNGELGIANPEFTLDMKMALKSVEKLLKYDIDKLICFHGGVFEKDIKKSLQKILLEQ